MLERAQRIGDLLRTRLEIMRQNDPRIGEVRGRGAMMAIEFIDPLTREPDAALTAAVVKACIGEGVIVLACGTFGNVIRFLRRPAARGARCPHRSPLRPLKERT